MTLFSRFDRVGFCGSRHLDRSSSAAVDELLALCGSAEIVTGCARGADELVRAACPSALVFSASDFGAGRRSFAARSAAMVRSLGADSALIGLVTSVCPAGVVPASTWRSGKPPSGTWSSLALAAGLGSTVFVVLAEVGVDGVGVPAWPCGAWKFATRVGGDMMFRWWPDYVKLSLFSEKGFHMQDRTEHNQQVEQIAYMMAEQMMYGNTDKASFQRTNSLGWTLDLRYDLHIYQNPTDWTRVEGVILSNSEFSRAYSWAKRLYQKSYDPPGASAPNS